jgi:hypothetical protein
LKKRHKILIAVLILLITSAIYFLPRFTKYHLPITVKPNTQKILKENKKIKIIAKDLFGFCKKNNYNQHYCFIVDMSIHSGSNRFFVYDFVKDTIVASHLVAHGSCREAYLEKAKFANEVNCGCSSLGKYKVSYAYNGQFGKAYKLVGLDKTNDKAFERNVVLHAYDCIPDKATFPQPICNSLGCPMVSYSFLNQLSTFIKQGNKPTILSIVQ